jgi:hypothetical protein
MFVFLHGQEIFFESPITEYFGGLRIRGCVLLLSFLLLLLLLLTAIEFSHGGSSPYTNTDKTNNIHKQKNIYKTEYKQYKTQYNP